MPQYDCREGKSAHDSIQNVVPLLFLFILNKSFRFVCKVQGQPGKNPNVPAPLSQDLASAFSLIRFAGMFRHSANWKEFIHTIRHRYDRNNTMVGGSSPWGHDYCNGLSIPDFNQGWKVTAVQGILVQTLAKRVRLKCRAPSESDTTPFTMRQHHLLQFRN